MSRILVSKDEQQWWMSPEKAVGGEDEGSTTPLPEKFVFCLVQLDAQFEARIKHLEKLLMKSVGSAAAGSNNEDSDPINAATAETEHPKWWERTSGPNMIDIHSTQEFLTSLSLAGEKLVIVEFYGTWCASCRALFPKLCRTAEEHPEVLFLKVNFDENKPMCKSLNVKVLPYFHIYRGADGQLESFSCSLAKFQKIKDAIQMHNTDRCSIGPPKGIGDLLELPKD